MSQKILALHYLSYAVTHCPCPSTTPNSFTSFPWLSEIYGFAHHEDDKLVMAAVSFLLRAELLQSIGGSAHHHNTTTKQLQSTLHRVLHTRSPSRLKAAFGLFADASSLLALNRQCGLLSLAVDYALGTEMVAGECDYFLVKTARAEFLASVSDWGAAGGGGGCFL